MRGASLCLTHHLHLIDKDFSRFQVVQAGVSGMQQPHLTLPLLSQHKRLLVDQASV